MGLREAASKPLNIAERTIALPVSGESVRIVGMSWREQRQWHKSLRGTDGKPDRRRDELSTELLLMRCVVDELGKPELTEQEVLAGAFDNLDSRDVQAMWDVAQELVFNRTTAAIDDALKNSPTPSSDSSVDSPDNAE